MKPPTKLRAPILIATCNRLKHFKALIDSLQACYWASETELYIAIDAPYSNEVREVNQEIIHFAENITGFSRLNLLRRTLNLGPNQNFCQAMDEIFIDHDILILLEDDNVVAKNFLVYMNEALDHFKDDPMCYSISGYNYTSKETSDHITDIYSSPCFSAWGVGLYREKHINLGGDLECRPDPYFLNPLNLLKVYFVNPPFFSVYMGMNMSQSTFGDVLHMMHCLKNNLFNVFPINTKVINNGFDGSGVHCAKADFLYHDGFESQDQENFVLELDGSVDKEYVKINSESFKE